MRVIPGLFHRRLALATGMAVTLVLTMIAPAQAVEPIQPIERGTVDDQVVADAVAELEARYTGPTVAKGPEGVLVEFDDRVGNHYRYEFTAGTNATQVARPKDLRQVNYQTTWHWWGWRYWLNRQETLELGTDGVNAAIFYAIAVAFGCTPCAVAAAIELGWATAANNYYNRGNCIYINNPWYTVGEHHSHGC